MSQEAQGGVRFSLVLAPVHRVTELERMIASLAAQTYRNFELILVDQNSDDRLTPIVERWKRDLRLLHLRTGPGLSSARNLGLTFARGELVGFPDDDCWYPGDCLMRVSEWFERFPEYSLLSTCSQDERGVEVASRWPRQSCAVDRQSVLMTCTTFCLFVRRQSVMDAGGFDEEMGPGSHTPAQAAEDLDLAARVIARGERGWFEKSIFVHHPRKDAASAPVERAFHYGVGFAYLLRKHHYGVQVWLYHVLRAFAGVARALFCLRFREARFYSNSARGRIAGYWHKADPIRSKSRSSSGLSSARG
jgi:glycosyltransferase involved in cell wall biosynthesis